MESKSCVLHSHVHCELSLPCSVLPGVTTVKKRGAISAVLARVREADVGLLSLVDSSCVLVYNYLLSRVEEVGSLAMCEGTVCLTCSLFFMDMM